MQERMIQAGVKRRASKELRAEILNYYMVLGVSVGVLSRRYGIAPRTIQLWKEKYLLESGPKREKDHLIAAQLEISRLRQENSHLKSRIADLSMERDILDAAFEIAKKKNSATQSLSLEKWLRTEDSSSKLSR